MPVIIKAPDPRLRQVSQPFDRSNPHHLVAIQDLKDAMEEYPRAMGLAAVQVGHMVRAIIIRGIGIMINPAVVAASSHNWAAGEECMSYPHLTPVKVLRPEWIELGYGDEAGQTHITKFHEWPARCIMHEIDHLNGITIDTIRRRK